MFHPIITIGTLFLVGEGAQQGDTQSKGAAHTEPETRATLRAESAALAKGSASDFFAALIRASDPRNREGFTDEVPEMLKQADRETREALRVPQLIRQTDKVTREVLRFSLDRGPVSGSRAPTSQERKDFRDRIVGHAEAIVLEAILRPAQAERWRGHATQPRIPPLPGRYSTIAVDYGDGQLPDEYRRDKYFNSIHQLQYERRASDLFFVLLDSPSEVVPAPTPDQVRLLGTLDLLARNVRRYAWVRGVEVPPRPELEGIGESPPTPTMEEKFSVRGVRMRASIAAHAEEMALEAVLTPEQAEQAKRALWRRRGLHALLDPELAGRLRLSRSQREELFERLNARTEVYHNAVRSGFPLADGKIPIEVVEAAQQRWREGLAQKMAAYDQPTWEILRPAQLRALVRLLGKPAAGPRPPAAKGKIKGAVRAG